LQGKSNTTPPLSSALALGHLLKDRPAEALALMETLAPEALAIQAAALTAAGRSDEEPARCSPSPIGTPCCPPKNACSSKSSNAMPRKNQDRAGFG
jgi:hypothetical protein